MGDLVLLEHQDRSRWDRAAIVEARDLIAPDLRTGRAGRYTVQAAIARSVVSRSARSSAKSEYSS